MHKFFYVSLLLCAASATADTIRPTLPPVIPEFDATGLASLQVNGIEQLASGTVRVTRVRTADEYRNPYELKDPYVKDGRTFADASVEVRESRFDSKENKLTQRFDWGSVAVSYHSAEGRFDMEIAVQNSSAQVIEQIAFDLLTLKVPEGAAIGKGGHNLGSPVLASIAPRITYFRRAAFPAARDEALDDLFGEDMAEEQDDKDVRILCPDCYPKAARDHLMETKQAAVPLEKVNEGVCAACGAETRVPPDPMVVAGTRQAEKPLVLQLAPGTATLQVVSGNEQAPEVYDGVWNVRPIKPGASEIIQVGLRFGPAGHPVTDVGADFINAFREAFPRILNWPDRRPISMAHLTYARGPERNRRGWWGLKDTEDDIRTPAGRAAFDKWILDYADQLIAVADKAGSQGVIVWDLEGKQYIGMVYYGDPRIMRHTAPEMEAMADAFFKKLTDAGLRVGVCLRPTQIYPNDVPDSEVEKYRKPNFFADMPYQETWDDFDINSMGLKFWHYGELGLREGTSVTHIERSPVERLDAKIRYCKERWGATLFYIDTNHFNRARTKSDPNAQGGYETIGSWERKLMSAQQWEELQRRHPDCLLIPEHEYPQYWASTAPYRQPPYDGPTPDVVRAVYPEAFACISMGGNATPHIEKAAEAYGNAIERGDLLMTLGWFGPPKVLTDIYAGAAESAPLRVTLNADGGLLLQKKPVDDLEALKQQVVDLVKGKPFAERRTAVRYAPAVSRGDRAALVAVLQETGAIIVRSQPMDGAGQ